MKTYVFILLFIAAGAHAQQINTAILSAPLNISSFASKNANSSETIKSEADLKDQCLKLRGTLVTRYATLRDLNGNLITVAGCKLSDAN